MSSLFRVVEPNEMMFLMQNIMTQKEDIILLYNGYQSIPTGILTKSSFLDHGLPLCAVHGHVLVDQLLPEFALQPSMGLGFRVGFRVSVLGETISLAVSLELKPSHNKTFWLSVKKMGIKSL